MNFIKTLFFLIFFLALEYSGDAQSKISLDEILSEVRSEAYSIQRANTDLEIASSNLKFLSAELKPSFGLNLLLPNFYNTSTQVTQPDGSISFQQITQNNSSISFFANQNIASTGGQIFLQSDLQRFDDFNTDEIQYNGIPIRIGFIQPLFGFNSFKWDKKILPLIYEEAKSNYNIAVEDAQWRATVLYFNVLLAQSNREIATINKGVNDQLVEITKERYALGKTSRDVLLQIEMSLKASNLAENQAINDVSLALNVLYTFMGKKNWDENSICSIPNPFPKISLNPDYLADAANKNRPEIQRYSRELLEGERNIAQRKSQYGINAELYAGFGFARGSQNINDIYKNPFDEQQIRLSVSVPLVDWGKKNEAVKIATLQRKNTKEKIRQESIELENMVRAKVGQFLQIQENINLLEEIKEVAAERFEISNERYTLGNISITDLTLAQREKDQTHRDYIQALNNYWSTYYELRTLCGLTTLN